MRMAAIRVMRRLYHILLLFLCFHGRGLGLKEQSIVKQIRCGDKQSALRFPDLLIRFLEGFVPVVSNTQRLLYYVKFVLLF